jgi:hypothetical protein
MRRHLFPSIISRGAPCQATPEISVSEERKNNLAYNLRLPRQIIRFFNMPQICDMGQTALLPFRTKACWGIFRPKKIRRLRPGYWVPEASMLTTRPPKPLDGRIMLRRIFREWDVGVRTGLGWLSIKTAGGHLWIRQWTFGFRKMQGISWLAAN